MDVDMVEFEEYRIEFINNRNSEIKVYDNSSAGNLFFIKKRKYNVFAVKYHIFDEAKVNLLGEIKSNFLRRKWSFKESLNKIGVLKFKWKGLGKGLTIVSKGVKFNAAEIERGKLIIKQRDNLRTAFEIDYKQLKIINQFIVNNYSVLPQLMVIGASFLSYNRFLPSHN